MIALSSDCLLFQMASGESLPLSAEMISVELVAGAEACHYDEEFVSHAANAVFYYFKHELGRMSVTLGEFAEALEKVLAGFKLPARGSGCSAIKVGRFDLLELAESGAGCELLFFPRLRDELRSRLQDSPELLRFSGLRNCVKCLAGAERWCARCQKLHEQIVAFVRHCLSTETATANCTLLVE
jgi:hypothetical protein